MNALVLLSLICAYQCAPAITDDSADTTTVSDTTTSGDTTVSAGPIDFDAFDADLDDVYKSIAKIKSKASKLELIGPKIQSAMLHLAGDEQDIAKSLQAKYAQILPFLQKLKSDDTVTQAAAANRRRRDASASTSADIGVTESANTANNETTNTDFTTDSSVTSPSADVTQANVTSSAASPTA